MSRYNGRGHYILRGVAMLSILCAALLASGGTSLARQYTPDCSDCHNMPPLDEPAGERDPDSGAFAGNHQTHAGTTAATCVKCHGPLVANYSTAHRGHEIKVSGNINNSPHPDKALYARVGGVFMNQTTVPPVGSCSNVNCHFEQATPQWGSAPLSAPSLTVCGTCHSATPTTNAHGAHLARYGAELATCAKCHTDHSAAANPFAHATSAGQSGRKIGVTAGSYAGAGGSFLPSQSASRTLGSCSATYCHSPGQHATGGALAAGDYATPNWGVPASGACGTCHATTGSVTGSHARHLANDTNCGNCHVNASPGAYSAASHNDGQIDVGLGGYSAGGAPGNGYGSCASASCHADPYGPTSIASPVWGSAAGCAACHKGAGLFAANGGPATGSHGSHLALPGAGCGQCHTGAVSGVTGGATHANGSVEVANDYSGSPVTKHAPGSYTGTCSSASCHASPYGPGSTTSPIWGTAAGCSACHNGEGAFAANGGPATGSHPKHLGLYAVGCGNCHTGAVSGVTGGASHTNGTVEVANGYTASPVTKHPVGTYSGSCTNASCHTDGNGTPVATPRWDASNVANGCAICHGGDASTTPAAAVLKTGKHSAHMNNYSTLGRGNNLACGECHAKTVSLTSNTVISTTANHVNGFKDYSGVKAGGSADYATATGVCSNAYCHSSGQATPVFRSMTGSRAWRGSARLTCNGCHGNEAGAAWNSGFGAPNYQNRYDGTLASANSHQKHTVAAGMTDSTGCARCHLTTVDAAQAGKLRDYSTAHLNRTRDVAFLLGGSYAAGTKGCSTYCHSNVQAPGGNAPATAFAAPVWGANGTMTCASCHNDMSQLAETPADLGLGSHKRHAVDSGYSCSLCHGQGYSPASYGASHADGNIELSFTGQAANTTYSQAGANLPGDGYGTCSTSKCHGRATRNWGVSTTLPVCEKCHGSANTAQTSGVFKDTAGSPASAYVGTHVSHLAGTHNYANPITCDQCHVVPASTGSFGHMSSLPARIVWGAQATLPSITEGGSIGAPMVPAYSGAPGRVCSNTYCHSGLRKKSDGTPQGTGPNPAWGDPGYLGGSGCDKCHAYPPAYPHNQSGNCSACHNHVAQSNIAFADKSKHLDGRIDVTVDDCLGCHSSVNACADGDPTCINKKLIGAHIKHTDADLFLAGKTLSNGDFIDPSWIYGIQYVNGFPKYACGFCHPMDSGSHKNGQVELDLDPSHSLVGTVKTRNKAGGPWVVTHDLGTSVVCNNVYCHSNGYISETTKTYQYQQTPDWYATNPWGSVDKCSQCHGNSPNSGGKEGSSAHARHVIGNHYKDVFNSYSGRIAPAGPAGSGAAHGDPATSTTFSCYLCHNATVKVAYNDQGSACTTCHNASGSAPLKGNLTVDPAGTSHINGQVDVVFLSPFSIKSKAQLRNDIAAVQSVYTSWTRVKGFKTFSSYDLSRTTPRYAGGTCSTVACHNGTQMEWRTKGPLACAACHTGLPQ